MAYYNLGLKQAYTFIMRAPAILGVKFENATVMGIMDYDSAKAIQDIVPLHRAAYPNLEVGTPRDAKDLTYIKLKTYSGEIRVIAMEWLAGEPTLLTSQTIRLTVANVNPQQVAALRDTLIQNGFDQFEIEFVLFGAVYWLFFVFWLGIKGIDCLKRSYGACYALIFVYTVSVVLG